MNAVDVLLRCIDHPDTAPCDEHTAIDILRNAREGWDREARERLAKASSKPVQALSRPEPTDTAPLCRFGQGEYETEYRG
jgi:uncharacterized protein YbjT (DUF2867 family)